MKTAKACRFATYSGDVAHAIGEVKGPNTIGEYLQVVAADYDAERNKTRLGFAYNLKRNDDGTLSMVLPVAGFES